MSVVQGNVNAVLNGSQFNVTASQNAVINWQSFNIAAGETTTFIQPSAMSVVWNRILDANPSQIWGSLNANGIVVLMNQNGFYFGPNSVVNVGGFIATSAAVFPPAEMGGGMWSYQGTPPAASIVNYGQIKVADGGSLFMIAEKIENHGILSAPDGTLGLYTGKSVLISERPDGRGLSANVTLPEGSIDNTGRLIADGGSIALHAQVVNQNGLIQANSVRNQNGVIELLAGDTVNLGPNSVLQANGDSTGASDGGKITIKSAGTFTDDSASRIEVRGGASGGNGGFVEISAMRMAGINSQLSGTAQAGWRGGSLLLDPYDIILGTSGNDSAGSGTVSAGDFSGATLQLDVNTAFQGFSQIALQAMHDIFLAQGTVWDLIASTGFSAPGCSLTLQAGNNIIFDNASSIQAGNGWSVNLSAGVDFSSPTFSTRAGIGSIYLNGGAPDINGLAPNFNGAIQATDGNISLNAGHEVLVGGGYIRTVNGGNISITTGDGDVNSGTDGVTYDYSRSGYVISPVGLGGIGTANGGNVMINAGRDIFSYNATIGAFGANLGNVNLIAARDVKGKFMLRNGTGNVHAGGNVGMAGTGAGFGLVSGVWNVMTDSDLFVNEVYNPNGSLNGNGMRVPGGVFPGNVSSTGETFPPVRTSFLFDYAPDAEVNLFGLNSVQLLGNDLAHTTDNASRSAIYAPILNVIAGAGGVVLGNDVILYPSSQGSLSITTTGGGSLRAAGGQFCQLIVSDSGLPDYKTFAGGHAITPLHLGGAGDGVTLDISGDIQNIFLRSPEAANILVHGNALNFAFEGQNLSGNDQTHLVIDGNFSSRSDRTAVILLDGPAQQLFGQIFNDPVLSTNPSLGARLTYNSTTHQLTIQGIMTEGDLNFLLHPTVYVLDPVTGQRKVDGNLNPIIVPATFTADIAGLQQLFATTQDIPTSTLARNGLQIGGPGLFDIKANNMDLGISSGIRSVGPLINPALASISLQGAGLDIELGGNLEMTSSQIASFNGGSILVNSSGRVDVGGEGSFTSDDTPKGIYTAHGGNVTVDAAADINVNGSRIATYDGGDVTVISEGGQINAGAGGKGFFYVTTSQIDPVTGKLVTRNDRFFGSGIMTTTRPDSRNLVGNITVTAYGDIVANTSGIFQLPFNTGTLIVDSGGILLGHIVPTISGGSVMDSAGVLVGYVLPDGSVKSTSGTIIGSISAGGVVNISVSGWNMIGHEQSPPAPSVRTVAGQMLTGLLTKGTAQNPASQNTSPVTVTLLSSDGSINAGDSGVLAGGDLSVDAPHGDVTGIFVTSGNAAIHGAENVSVTVLAGGTASVSGQSVSGSVVGGGDVSVSGSDVTASAISTGGSASGGASGGGAFTGVAAPTSEKAVESADKAMAAQTLAQNDDDEKKKRVAGKGPALMRRVGRVTVILPKT